tara:strand:+ start:1116 stop:1307 length:192 start_codon:yes stop_codon:yes gene_type:complete
MNNFTHFDFEKLSNEERELNKKLNPNKKIEKAPEIAVNAIISYSKALSVRKSEHVNYIEQILN